MKTIRQTLILLTFALFFAANVTAAPLDERQRTVETVVADALAQLPAATAGDYDKIMGELAATGAEGVGILADMLVPASQGENAAVEYALNGVASFVTAAGREQLRPAVCEGLLAALARCKDDANRAFLVSQLQLCATADNAAALAAYIDDPYLGDPVLRALISIPDSEATLLSLARRSDLSDAQRAALERGRGGVRLTKDGERVAPAIREFLQANARLDSTIAQVASSRSEVIRVSAFASMAMHWLPSIIRRFREERPDVDVDIRMADHIRSPYELLAQGKMDVIFVSHQEEESGYEWIHLRDDTMYAVLPKDYPIDGRTGYPLS